MQPIDEQLVQMCSSEIEDASIKYANGHATDFRAVARIIIAALRTQADAQPFQARVQPWMMACFGAEISADKQERNHRFLEEALELVQACGATASEAHQLVDYVYGRPVGDKHQEIGGVMVTLAALCLAQDEDMHAAGETELARIWTKVDQIRAKQAAKPKHSPLPQHVPAPEAAQALSDEDILAIADRHHTNCNAGLIAFVRAILTRSSATPAMQALSEAIAICQQEGDEWNSDAVQSTKNYAHTCRDRIAQLLTRASAATVAEPSETDRAVRCLSREPSEKVKAVYTAWAHENGRRAKTLADRIINDYLLHYDFPTQGQSHMQDCIVSVLSAALTEAPQAAQPAESSDSRDDDAEFRAWREQQWSAGINPTERDAWMERARRERDLLVSVATPAVDYTAQQQAEPVGDSLDARLRDALRGLGNVIADPMWADHAEVGKACLKYWHKTMHEARQTLRAPLGSPAEVLAQEAYDLGWLRCVEWSGRDDLVCDMQSPAYLKGRTATLNALAEKLAKGSKGDPQ